MAPALLAASTFGGEATGFTHNYQISQTVQSSIRNFLHGPPLTPRLIGLALKGGEHETIFEEHAPGADG